MAILYQYEAKNPQGKIIKGQMRANSEQEVEKILWHNRIAVISVAPKKGFGQITIFSRITVRDKAIFARQTATMLKAGFPLLQAMSVIVLQTNNEKFKTTVNGLIKDLEDGQPFSVALSKFPKLFSQVYVNLVRSGEATGKLPKVMEEIANDIEKQAQLNSQIRGAMYYPVFVFVALVGIGVLMMIKVIPQLKQIFEGANVRLPWTTRSVIWLSEFLQNWWWATLVGVVVIAIAMIYLVRTAWGRRVFDKLKLKLPIIKDIVKNIYMERFSRTFSLLSFAGVPILDTIKISSKVVGNVLYEEQLEQTYKEVERGIPLSQPLSQRPKFFPPLVSQMIGVGEKTGQLESILRSVARYYQEEVDRQVKALSSLIEPIMIIIIGFGVAIMVFSVIVPIYQIAQTQIQ